MTIYYIIGFFLSLFGTGLVGWKLNEGRHRKKQIDVAKKTVDELKQFVERDERRENEYVEKIIDIVGNDLSADEYEQLLNDYQDSQVSSP